MCRRWEARRCPVPRAPALGTVSKVRICEHLVNGQSGSRDASDRVCRVSPDAQAGIHRCITVVFTVIEDVMAGHFSRLFEPKIKFYPKNPRFPNVLPSFSYNIHFSFLPTNSSRKVGKIANSGLYGRGHFALFNNYTVPLFPSGFFLGFFKERVTPSTSRLDRYIHVTPKKVLSSDFDFAHVNNDHEHEKSTRFATHDCD